MALSKEELLRPRFKVVADYPGNEWEVGSVLEKMKNTAAWLSPCNNINIGMRIEAAEKYPHLFRKLEWHEDRKQEEMPEYVKWREEGPFGPLEIGGNIEKVELIEPAFGSLAIKVPSQINGIRPEYFMPATEAEFNSQKQTTNG